MGVDRTRWTLESLRGACPWLRLRTAPGLWQVLQRLGIHYKCARSYYHSPDPDYVAKLQAVQACLRATLQDSEEVVLLFQDELTYYRQPTLAPAYEAAGAVQPLARRSYRKNDFWRTVAALDALTGRVIHRQSRHIGREELVSFYEQIRQAYPRARTIYLVQDNWPVHYHPDVLFALQPQQQAWSQYLARNWPTDPGPKARKLELPIQLVHLPTYAPWTNPIEKLWRKLKQEVLHLHLWADDWEAINQAVSAFLRQFAEGAPNLLRYVGLSNPLRLYKAILPPLPP